MKRALASLATAAIMLAGSANAGELVIIFDDLNPGPKAAFEKVVADFDAANPDITVNLSINDREAHKTAIRNFLSAGAPDVTAWARLSTQASLKTSLICGLATRTSALRSTQSSRP